MAAPVSTRLRYIRAVSADELSEFVSSLPFSIQIYSLVHDGSAWFLWYVPPDDMPEAPPNVENI